MENWIALFRGWVKELVPLAQVEDYTRTSGRGPDGDEDTKAWVEFYTAESVYKITARSDRLVCDATSRAWRAGEDWHRGQDCGDGDFSKATWDAIVRRILQSELVKRSKRGIAIADDTPNTAVDPTRKTFF